MSQRDNFLGGFLLGTLVGGVVGGVLGAVTASRLTAEETPENLPEGKPRPLAAPKGKPVDMEAARRKLEGKIAQLNDAIDDVRQQLGGINGGHATTVDKAPPANREN